ncbi:MAG: hypothetical protein DCF19_17530 [Pseudanabaena frigida]|uniref:General secretion pathway protein GspH n=1 Tax=Pseudanabaena frigida TaxID=945775 RepID=A0A2W4VYP9_9CYAN|nr:MAG: hypothetical protein DCF19_17530 [Pseudanabaena frigida]
MRLQDKFKQTKELQANDSQEKPLKQKKTLGRSLLIWSFYSLIGGSFLAIIILNFFPYLLNPDYGGCSEAKTYLGSINRSQQSYYLENQVFRRNISDLTFPENTTNFKYEVQTSDPSRFTYHYAITKNDALKGYVGAVFVVMTNSGEETTIAILCKSSGIGLKGKKLPNPSLQNGVPTCAEGTYSIR